MAVCASPPPGQRSPWRSDSMQMQKEGFGMLISIYGDSILKSVVCENGAYRTERDFAKQFSRRYEVQKEMAL